MFAGFVIFAIIGFIAHEIGVGVDEVAKGGRYRQLLHCKMLPFSLVAMMLLCYIVKMTIKAFSTSVCFIVIKMTCMDVMHKKVIDLQFMTNADGNTSQLILFSIA